MNQFMQFFTGHWMLFVALIAIIGVILFEETKSTARGVAQVSPQQATHLINHDNAIVVDVRDADSFQNGRLIDAINIVEGYPSEGATTYCSYEFNNTKWIVKYSPNIGMNVKFGYEPVDFEYIEPDIN